MLLEIVLTAGCDRDDTITAYVAPQDAAPSAVTGDATPSATQPSVIATWTAPPAWAIEPAKPMRLASWQTTDNNGAAEIVISQFAAGGFGDTLQNINRWRGMVGLPAIANGQAAPPQTLSMGASKVDVYDFTGAAMNASRVRVAMMTSPNGDMVLFVRMKGPATAVARHADDFDSFLRTIRFTP